MTPARVERLRAKLLALARQSTTSGERSAAEHLLRRLNIKYSGEASVVVTRNVPTTSRVPDCIYWGDIRTHDPVTGEIGKAGHFAWLPCGNLRFNEWAPPSLHDPIRAYDASRLVMPGAYSLRGTGFEPDEQVQGDFQLTTQTVLGVAWSVLAWWDRTGDRRYGSNSQFWLMGEHEVSDVARLGVAHFPLVAQRQIPGTRIATLFGMALALSAPATTRVFYLPAPAPINQQ